MNSPIVLVLDDEPGITMLCKRILSRAGFETAALTDPRQAMNLIATQKIDLLVVDIRMPEVDGFDVISFAQQHQPDIAVLVMTGFGTVETAIRALRQGVDGLLLKPFQQGDELIQAVKLALDDNQKKRDAARIQALRPLFAVTESLFSETRPEPLLDLILTAVCGHLRCSHAAFYQFSADGDLRLLASRGKSLPDSKSKKPIVDQIAALDASLIVHASGPGDAGLQAELSRLDLSGALFAPIARLDVRSMLFAGRSAGDLPFSDSDLEMFLVLGRQAVIALENARLYAELRDYVRRVEESQQALLQAEKMAAAGRLTASIAHEINNPLQAVQNCIHLAGRGDLPVEKRQEYFGLAQAELDRLQTTVQRMLDFYRPNAVNPTRVDVAELLRHVLGLMSRQLEERGIRVKLDVPSSLPEILVVSSQLQQVFINLVLNAFDAMEKGGDLKINARPARGGVEILFQDSGPGVPAERRTSIFDPFYSTKTGGTGLGLTVSYNIVTAHGGSLDLLGERGPGACFRVFLPSGGGV
ncbi:MAG: response regulator [Chloroflexota bacterium]